MGHTPLSNQSCHSINQSAAALGLERAPLLDVVVEHARRVDLGDGHAVLQRAQVARGRRERGLARGLVVGEQRGGLVQGVLDHHAGAEPQADGVEVVLGFYYFV